MFSCIVQEKKFHNFEARANTKLVSALSFLHLFQLLQKDVRSPATNPTNVGPVMLMAQMYINARVPLICAMEL